MTLEWTDIELPIGGGIDTKTNEKLLKPPRCADLSDAVFPAAGTAGYETRKGYDRIRTATRPTDIRALFPRERELLANADCKLYSVSELANNVDLVDRGNLLSVAVNQSTLSNQSANQTSGTVIEHQGMEIHAWTDSAASGVKYTVLDSVTGTVISANTLIASAESPTLVRIDDSVLLVYYSTSSTAVRATIIPSYDPTATTDVSIAPDSSDGVYAVCEHNNLDHAFLAYNWDDSGSARLAALTFDSSGTASTNTQVSSDDANGLAVSAYNTRYTVVRMNSDTGNIFGADEALLQDVSNGFVELESIPEDFAGYDSIATIFHEETHHIWVTVSGATDRDNIVRYYTLEQLDRVLEFDEQDPDIVFAGELHHSSLASTPFIACGEPMVHVAFCSPLQSTYFLINTSLEVQAKCCVGIGYGSDYRHLPTVTNGTWAAVYREHLDVDLNPDDTEDETKVFSQFGLKKIRYNFNHRPSAIEYGRCSYLASGILWAYDGETLTEQGFHVYPEGITSSETATSGNLTLLKSYSYRVYYEWTNARGERQRSTTAQAVTQQLTGANNQVTLEIPTLAHTNKGDNVSIVVYRTLANPNLNGGAPFYRCSSPNPGSTGNNAWLANDTSTETVDFVDDLADTDLAERELDYLNSGERDNTSASPGAIIGESKKRVWIAGLEQESRVYYSKLNSRGTDALEFHDTFALDVPELGGAVTAIGSLTYHTVLFKADSIYVVSGEGPDNLGRGAFNLPQVVSLDVGCIEQRSLVNIPGGLMFKSNKGLWIVTDNLQVQYIGANVEAYNAQTVTDATIIPSENHVVFLTSSGSALVYNYLVSEWSRFTNHAGNDGCIWNGTYTYARTDGRIYRQSDVNYSDDGIHYTMRWVSAPIALRGIQGRQKIRYARLLGEYYSLHNLRVGLRYDHHRGTLDEGTWDPRDAISVDVYGLDEYGLGAYGGSGSPVYQARFNLPRQSCQTLQLVIDTVNTDGAGRAMSIQAIQLSAGAEAGSAELAVAASFSASGASTT